LTDQSTKTCPISIFWFRRDLRLNDNAGLYHALKDEHPVLPLFIFDTDILNNLTDKTDRRVEFIQNALAELQTELEKFEGSLFIKCGCPIEIWKQLVDEFEVAEVYMNHDYEPLAINRDNEVGEFLSSQGISVHSFKDQVIFEKDEVVKSDGSPYTVYTPYMKKWKSKINDFNLPHYPCEKHFSNFYKSSPEKIPSLEELGFKGMREGFPSKAIDEALLRNYQKTRDYPGINGTSRLSVHLRFGTVSIRELVRTAMNLNETWLQELIWREFFMMILYHFPHVVDTPFREKYQKIKWYNDKEEFRKWREGKTGFPIVDAGMRELNATGYMHNRVRMIAANFLTKLLLIDWLWGERYFAEKLLDYELSSNNGNWQWAAGCGCDAAPYFRIFNPDTQMKKFDPELKYVKKWVPEYGTDSYVKPMIDYKSSRQRALMVYKEAIG
jgi:deoxyribodipyrimidine photo-lyase